MGIPAGGPFMSSKPAVMLPLPSAVKLPIMAICAPVASSKPCRRNAYCPFSGAVTVRKRVLLVIPVEDAVIAVTPGATAVASPELGSIVATFGALLVQMTVSELMATPLLSRPLAENWSVALVAIASGVAVILIVASAPGVAVVVVVVAGVEELDLEQPERSKQKIAIKQRSGKRVQAS